MSDQTYLLRFSFGNPLLNAMISRAYLEGFEPRASTDVNAYLFQPLQPGLGDSTQPIVLPVINRNWQSEPDELRRHAGSSTPTCSTSCARSAPRHAALSLGGEWDKTFRDGIGGQYKFTASLRGDGYSVSNLSSLSNPDLPSAYFSINGAPATEPIGYSYVAGRAFPQLGLTWNYPLVHRVDEHDGDRSSRSSATYVGPERRQQPRASPNEDSLGYRVPRHRPVPPRPASPATTCSIPGSGSITG